jgi:SHS2 domain-containing protein
MTGGGEPPRYQLLEHTADVAVRVRGRDLPELFRALAFAVVDLMARAESVAPQEERRLEAHGGSIEELVVAWANEILFRLETERLLLPWLDIEAVTPTCVRGIARGESLDADRHGWKGELKSATYHELAVRRDEVGGEWVAELVLDV